MAYEVMIDAGHAGTKLRKSRSANGYAVERHYLAEISAETLLTRIADRHRKEEAAHEPGNP